MCDLHSTAESIRELERFARLPLVDMARELSKYPEPKPCNLCAELGRPCIVHRG
jgi:hypothetical protein